MKLLKTVILGTALAVGASFLIYKYVLDDEAKEAVDGAVDASKRAIGEVSAATASLKQQLQEKDIIPTSEELKAQWSKLGF